MYLYNIIYTPSKEAELIKLFRNNFLSLKNKTDSETKPFNDLKYSNSRNTETFFYVMQIKESTQYK